MAFLPNVIGFAFILAGAALLSVLAAILFGVFILLLYTTIFGWIWIAWRRHRGRPPDAEQDEALPEDSFMSDQQIRRRGRTSALLCLGFLPALALLAFEIGELLAAALMFVGVVIIVVSYVPGQRALAHIEGQRSR
ncbi:MAG: hypothetical protein ACRDL6_02190 [Solirubrobacterales bacterium]